MSKLTLTNDDGTTVDYFPQSYTDAAVAAVTPAPVAETIKEVDVVDADGTTEKFVPETPAA